MLFPCVVLVLAVSPPDVRHAVPEIRAFVAEASQRERLWRYLEEHSRKAFRDDPELQRAVWEAIAANLAEKQGLADFKQQRFSLSPEEIEKTVIDYEIFKLKTFLSSGVFPKRYFGYFDEKWDTAEYERILKKTVHDAVQIINPYQQKKNSSVRVTDIEIAITFIAEGGALLLREHQAHINDIHPVYGVGLDDIATGLKLYADLASALDQHFRTHLKDVVFRDNSGHAYLRRNMNFKEAILGTALMYVYEKELANSYLQKEGVKLAELSLEKQFIVGSLVYNSGKTFKPESREQIRVFATAEELVRVSTRNIKTRGELPVTLPAESRARILKGEGYPEQPTNWSALYHILQRYGAYQCMTRMTQVFDAQGMFVL